jgi:hypothetical protein
MRNVLAATEFSTYVLRGFGDVEWRHKTPRLLAAYIRVWILMAWLLTFAGAKCRLELSYPVYCLYIFSKPYCLLRNCDHVS